MWTCQPFQGHRDMSDSLYGNQTQHRTPHHGPAHEGSRAPRTLVYPGALEPSDFPGKKSQTEAVLLRLTSADTSRSPSRMSSASAQRGAHTSGEMPSVALSAPAPRPRYVSSGVNMCGVWVGAGSGLPGGREAQWSPPVWSWTCSQEVLSSQGPSVPAVPC